MTNALAIRPVTADDWALMLDQAKTLVATKFLPSAIDTPEKAVAIMLKGRELGIPAMYALSKIAIIGGKPVTEAELMLALIYRDHGDGAVQFTESTNERCTVQYKRRSWSAYRTHSFDIDDAKRAGLLSKDTWQKYPDAMLRARCVSAMARMGFPDSIGGMYTPEEMGADVEVNEHGEFELTGSPSAPTHINGHAVIDADVIEQPAEAPAKDEAEDPAYRERMIHQYETLLKTLAELDLAAAAKFPAAETLSTPRLVKGSEHLVGLIEQRKAAQEAG